MLRALKADAEALLGAPVLEAVISVPAYFSDSQRQATRIAGELAGLKVERLINEPTAAALAYGLHQQQDETQFLVFDLGGGTFDVSVLELFEGVMEVRATAGDNFLGGEDFVAEIVKQFLQRAEVPAQARDDPRFMQQLLAQAEIAKIKLSQQAESRLRVAWRDTEYALDLTQDRLADWSEPLLARLRAPVERALRDARIRSADIATVVLAGGATRMPLVRQLVTRMFGRFPNIEMNPDEVVAAGAAVMAGLKIKDQALDEVVMTDVSLHAGCRSHAHPAVGPARRRTLSPIIERNSVVPISREETYSPVDDDQPEVELNIYQGESRLVRDNILLGTLKMPLSRRPRAESSFQVRFTYDVNGLLEVEAGMPGSSQRQRIVIQSADRHMSDAEVQRRLEELASLKIHPREQTANRTPLARAERVYQVLRGDERQHLANEILLFEQVIEQQNARLIPPARARLTQEIDALERYSVFDRAYDPGYSE